MTSQPDSRTFALRPVFNKDLPDGAWWPHNRNLSDQLKKLYALWPETSGRIARVLYSPPDWDDHPRTVDVNGKQVKTGSFPEDDTHELTVTLFDGKRRIITVIPPAADADAAHQILNAIAPTHTGPQTPDEHPEWDNEGGTNYTDN